MFKENTQKLIGLVSAGLGFCLDVTVVADDVHLWISQLGLIVAVVCLQKRQTLCLHGLGLFHPYDISTGLMVTVIPFHGASLGRTCISTCRLMIFHGFCWQAQSVWVAMVCRYPIEWFCSQGTQWMMVCGCSRLWASCLTNTGLVFMVGRLIYCYSDPVANDWGWYFLRLSQDMSALVFWSGYLIDAKQKYSYSDSPSVGTRWGQLDQCLAHAEAMIEKSQNQASLRPGTASNAWCRPHDESASTTQYTQELVRTVSSDNGFFSKSMHHQLQSNAPSLSSS